ncbi:MAG: 16S rRNA (uracil(1498)-N(3))-methyltransferase [Bacilli bacterium]|nr:16S rRNA (uracil(1498)-N(3))-methyltransferase [Bacilli bacterium]
MQKYFVNPNNFYNDYSEVIIDKDDSFHIVKVMRMRVGDEVLVSDNQDSYLTKIKVLDEKGVILEVIEKQENSSELPLKVSIAQGLVRKDKMEEVLSKITALGANCYIPVNMERSNIKIKEEKKDRQLKIIKEASEQSMRNKLMELSSIISFKDLLKLKTNYDVCLFASTKASLDNPNLKQVLKNKDIKSILVVVGPEGGISPKEEELMEKANFLPITLGPRILRTELAPIYIMSAISYETELG